MSRFEGRFLAIDERECLALLRTQQVGRVGWSSEDGQLILPVTYELSEDGVLFRTSETSVLAQLVTPTPVAFQVDVIDAEARNGWSVLIGGTTRPGTATSVTPWAPGNRGVVIEIVRERLTGRAVISAEG